MHVVEFSCPEDCNTKPLQNGLSKTKQTYGWRKGEIAREHSKNLRENWENKARERLKAGEFALGYGTDLRDLRLNRSRLLLFLFVFFLEHGGCGHRVVVF
jgi:hypothetical protein